MTTHEPEPAGVIPDAAVRAALTAWWDAPSDEVFDSMRYAILAAQPFMVGEAEPVAWRWRGGFDDKWSVTTDAPNPEGEGCDVEPLYLLPALVSAPNDAREMVAARDVLAERERQKSVEGWTPEHDDAYHHDELSNAAACYASPEAVYWGPSRDRSALRWPWQVQWWKPSDRRRDLVKAGALILAEIERLDRALARRHPAPDGGAR